MVRSRTLHFLKSALCKRWPVHFHSWPGALLLERAIESWLSLTLMRFPSCSLLAFAPPFSGTIPNSQTFSKVTGLVFLLRVRHSLSSTSKPATGSRSFRFSLGWMTKQSHLPDADHIGGTCKGAAPTTNKQTNKQTNKRPSKPK